MCLNPKSSSPQNPIPILYFLKPSYLTLEPSRHLLYLTLAPNPPTSLARHTYVSKINQVWVF
jgi:hypothetical protein